MNDISSFPVIKLGLPGEEISKKDLHKLIQRFKNLNLLRFNRVQSYLQPRQQLFLDLLPLLFHINHPLLPGFISTETIAGLPDFQPTKKSLQTAKQFSKNFTYKKKALLEYGLDSIFLMGSISSIAFSRNSDIDIWLCHRTGFSVEQLEQLQAKANNIEAWADELNLEVHFFLIDSHQFRLGKHEPISDESSGNTQHYILLEEFYRTSIYIAGKVPAWWIVPPDQESSYDNYLNHLMDHRFVSENEIIDFGGFEEIPVNEFVSATLWHIFKAINSPYKSLLKLFLMEAYAKEYPKPDWLCYQLKQAIYQGKIDLDKLDPYFMIYDKVENYLRNFGSLDRLNLARQCFYLKMSETYATTEHWKFKDKQLYLENIARQWNWPENLLPNLYKRKFWDIKKANQEHLIIRSQLKHCLRMMLTLAGTYQLESYRNNEDLKLISRKLHAFLEKKSGKIEKISTRFNVQMTERSLIVVESGEYQVSKFWSLYSGDQQTNDESAYLIKQETSLLSLLVWVVVNGLYNPQLKIFINTYSLALSASEVQTVLHQFAHFLSERIPEAVNSLEIYKQIERLQSALLVINLGHEVQQRDDGLLIMSERSDPLSYGSDRQCFVQQIDLISVSNWGEISTRQYQGVIGILNCFLDLYNGLMRPFKPDQVVFRCDTAIRGKSIALRLEKIFVELVRIFSAKSSVIQRYLLTIKKQHFVFEMKQQRLSYRSLEIEEGLYKELARSQPKFSHIYFDQSVETDPLIPFLFSLNAENKIQLFFERKNQQVFVHVLDENGAYFSNSHSNANEIQLASHYLVFFQSILNHAHFRNEIKVECYQLYQDTEFKVSLMNDHRIYLQNENVIDLRVVIESGLNNKTGVDYQIYYNEVQFHSAELGKNLFKAVADYIKASRLNSEHYSVYISEVDAPCNFFGVEDLSDLQSIHYLAIKQLLEQKLNSC